MICRIFGLDFCNLITTNPRLSEFGFARMVDPMTAFQRLSMFIGNNLTTHEDPDIVMTDELKVHANGFDKWSFRKKVR